MGKLARIKDEFPHRNSPVALTFEAEIKRISIEKDLTIGQVMTKLAGFANVDVRQLYNYRSGKTDIPSLLIPKFCKQFHSNALAMAIVSMCNKTEFEERDEFDLTRFCSKTLRDQLQHGDDFLEAFDDGTIDGHELTKLSLSTTKIIRNANRLLEIATFEHNRRRPVGEVA